MAKPLVCIDGASGTVGLSLFARLSQRTDLDVAGLNSRTSATERKQLLGRASVTVLCLPETAAREAVSRAEPGARILDASPAHRIAEGWVYGLPELECEQAERIRRATRVSNPGCYATGAVLLLRPLAGLLTGLVSITAVGGYSAGGKAMIAQQQQAALGYRLYGLDLAHRHVPEIQRYGYLEQSPVFMPAVAGHQQGTIVQIPLHLPALGLELDGLLALYRKAYHGTAVQVVDSTAARYLDAAALAGSDGVELRLFPDAQGVNVMAVAQFDNLGKGAAGAAEQNLALMLGLEAVSPV